MSFLPFCRVSDLIQEPFFSRTRIPLKFQFSNYFSIKLMGSRSIYIVSNWFSIFQILAFVFEFE